MGVAATVAPKGLGPQDPTKKLAHWGNLLGRSLTSNWQQKCIEKGFTGPPLPIPCGLKETVDISTFQKDSSLELTQALSFRVV